MKVLKFGGTSVGTVDAIRRVGEIITGEAPEHEMIIVVSAVGGITNKLEATGRIASQGLDNYVNEIDSLRSLHLELFRELTGTEDVNCINDIFHELYEVCRGIYLLKELSPRSLDFVLSFGERLSSYIISEFFKTLKLDVALHDARKLILTDQQFNHANVDFKATEKLLNDIQLSKINLFGGFIASSYHGETTTLGRGGSDYSASLLAKIFKADILEIWTDVSGLMTADPRLVKQAHYISNVSYEEALELSHFGAKVIYPPSIQPALEKRIPILIKNTFEPSHPGTLVKHKEGKHEELIRGISSIRDIALLNLTGSSMVGIPRFSFRLFQALSDQQVNVILITQASSEHSICVGISKEDISRAREAVSEEFEMEIVAKKINPVEIEEDLSIVAVVGSQMRHQVGVSGQMFNVLGRNGVSVKAIAQGSSERNISAVVPQKDLKKAINVLHESFFVSEIKRINLFVIGVGNVGRAFLKQLENQHKYLEVNHHLNLKLTGIANSRKMSFDINGIDYEKWDHILNKGTKFEHAAYIQKMDDFNLRNSLFIDITGSKDIASLYNQVLEKSISIVTPNKIAATSPYSQYLELKSTARRFKTQFLFETNVCAGLPVISTLNDLIKSGDKVVKIQAVLSGTLNYLFNEYDGSVLFVDIIKKARELGLTEPDPRLDLFGEDVKRKILILIRESGYKANLENIRLDSFLPDQAKEDGSLEDFYEIIKMNESYFHEKYAKAQAESKKLKVVATFENGKGRVGLESVSSDHPFYNLEGKDNIILFFTSRYNEQPLVIKGAGAGAEVTASGIFADVLKVAQSNE